MATRPCDSGSSPVLRTTSLLIGDKYTGKVRDVYATDHHLVLVTTDRLSAFDRLLACVPYKGHVLNRISAYWFEATRHIIPNHVIATPHPNVTIAKRCTPFRIEFVVRAYLTGTTSTSIWMHYKAGARTYCGHALPDGMVKNQALPAVLCTPTTKDDVHDRPISGDEVVSEGWMTKEDWEYTSAKAVELFKFGQAVAASRGLILVDTKYEFGKEEGTGVIHLIDEVHTPDSSRYWIAASYEERMGGGKEPENIDKEFLRLWFRDNCDPYHDVTLPAAPPHLVTELSNRYIQLYEAIMGDKFDRDAVPATADALINSVEDAVHSAFPPAPLRSILVYTRPCEAAARATHTALRKLMAPASAAPVGTHPPGAGVIFRTAMAVESHVLDAIAAPAATVQTLQEVRCGRASHVPTVLLVHAGSRVDHVSPMAAVHTTFPIISIMDGDSDAAPATGTPPAVTAALAEAHAAALPIVFAPGPAAAAAHVARLLHFAAMAHSA